MKIKEMSKENRPRERLYHYGTSSLSNAELLAIILQKGTKNENVIDISNRLISKYGIDKLSSCSFKELQNIKGIGFAKACQIIALFELGKRQKVKLGKTITCAEDVYNHCKRICKDREHFMILLLDTKNRIIKEEIVSIGTLNSSLIHPREVFKSAIKESANSIILVHNHPSGDVEPSEEDKDITKKLIEVGEVVGIKVLDHVIVGGEKWMSLSSFNQI